MRRRTGRIIKTKKRRDICKDLRSRPGLVFLSLYFLLCVNPKRKQKNNVIKSNPKNAQNKQASVINRSSFLQPLVTRDPPLFCLVAILTTNPSYL